MNSRTTNSLASLWLQAFAIVGTTEGAKALVSMAIKAGKEMAVKNDIVPEAEAAVQRIMNIYPDECPKCHRNTKKTRKAACKLKKVLQAYPESEVAGAMMRYLDTTTVYIVNLGTWVDLFLSGERWDNANKNQQ